MVHLPNKMKTGYKKARSYLLATRPRLIFWKSQSNLKGYESRQEGRVHEEEFGVYARFTIFDIAHLLSLKITGKIAHNIGTAQTSSTDYSILQAGARMCFAKCQSVVVRDSQAFSHNCETKRVAILNPQKKICGSEPMVTNASLSFYGHNSIPPFKPCFHDGHFTSLRERTQEWNGTKPILNGGLLRVHTSRPCTPLT